MTNKIYVDVDGSKIKISDIMADFSGNASISEGDITLEEKIGEVWNIDEQFIVILLAK